MGAPNPDGWPTPHPRNPFQLSPIFRSPFSFGAEDSTLANAIMGGHQRPFPSTFPEQPCLRVRRTQVPRVIEEMWFLPKSLPAGTDSNFPKTTQILILGGVPKLWVVFRILPSKYTKINPTPEGHTFTMEYEMNIPYK